MLAILEFLCASERQIQNFKETLPGLTHFQWTMNVSKLKNWYAEVPPQILFSPFINTALNNN